MCAGLVTHMYMHVQCSRATVYSNTYVNIDYGVALVSRIDTIIGLFCKRALQKSQYSAKKTYNLIDPTNRSHPIKGTHLNQHSKKQQFIQLPTTHCNTHCSTHCNAATHTATHTATHIATHANICTREPGAVESLQGGENS